MKSISSATSLIKNLPATSERATLIKQILSVNLAFYGIYKLSSGPTQVRLARDLTLQAESGPQTLFTYHFCHTSLLPLVFNCGVMATVGHKTLNHHGSARFIRLLAVCALGSASFAAYDIRNNAN